MPLYLALNANLNLKKFIVHLTYIEQYGTALAFIPTPNEYLNTSTNVSNAFPNLKKVFVEIYVVKITNHADLNPYYGFIKCNL